MRGEQAPSFSCLRSLKRAAAKYGAWPRAVHAPSDGPWLPAAQYPHPLRHSNSKTVREVAVSGARTSYHDDVYAVDPLAPVHPVGPPPVLAHISGTSRERRAINMINELGRHVSSPVAHQPPYCWSSHLLNCVPRRRAGPGGSTRRSQGARESWPLRRHHTELLRMGIARRSLL